MGSLTRWICLFLIIFQLLMYVFIHIPLQQRTANISTDRREMLCKHTSRLPYIHVYRYNWTILLTVNEGFHDVFSNWWWHFQKLGIDVPIIIVAEDDEVYTKLQAEFQYVFKNSVTVEKSSLNSTSKAARHGTAEYKKLVSARPTYILKHLQEGLNLLYSDIDTVWLKNPFPYFNETYDMWIEQEDGKTYCTGFMAIKSNNKTMKLVKDWEKGLSKNLQLNQPMFNKILKASSVKFKPLNETVFPHGPSFKTFNEQQRSQVVVMHNTFVYGHKDKVERFKKLNLWFQTLQSV